MSIPEINNTTIIVVAHPDDEVLWFSSIVGDVGEVVVCFSDYQLRPDWGRGQRKSLLEHPAKNISCLGIQESGIFNCVNWDNPVISKFGLEIPKKIVAQKKYRENYYALLKALKGRLEGCVNVFTHNPWGEYGNEEHVQVYRVIKELQREMAFNVWFPSYCSNASLNFMMRYVCGFDGDYFTLKTNNTLGRQAMDIYKKHDCWTWYNDWEWSDEESFIKDEDRNGAPRTHGHLHPLNMIKVDYSSDGSDNAQKRTSTWNPFHNLITRIVETARKKSEKDS